jgi:hypothetical protein
MKIIFTILTNLLFFVIIIHSVSAQLGDREKHDQCLIILDNLHKTQTQIAVQSAYLMDTHPAIQYLKGKREELLKLLKENALYCPSSKQKIPYLSNPKSVRGL